MLKRFWGDTKEFYCLNHKEPALMYVFEGSSSPFYACRRYMLKDEEHPDGHEENEQGCSNRLSFNAAIGIMDYIMREVESDISGIGCRDYTGWAFKYRNIEARILECDARGNITKIGILNPGEIRNWEGV